MKSRKEKNSYMKNYRKKNKEEINSKNRERFANLTEEEKENVREKNRIRNKKYREKNRDKINNQLKENNWYYNKEIRKEQRKTNQKNNPASGILTACKSRCKKKNLEFNLTKDWYYEQFEKGCAVTGLPLEPVGSKSPWTAHIDRIIPEKGYIKENCRLVCACYNLAKKNWQDKDVYKMAEALIRTSDE